MTETQRWNPTATPPFTAMFADEFPTPWMVRRAAPEYGQWSEIVAANGRIVHQFDNITHMARIAPAMVAAINAHANGGGRSESAAEAAIEIANLRDDAVAAHEALAQARRRVAHLEQVIETATDHVHKWLALTLNGQPGSVNHIERAWTTLVLQAVVCYGVSAAVRDASPSRAAVAMRSDEMPVPADVSSDVYQHQHEGVA